MSSRFGLDVWIEISYHLDLKDAITVIQTCSALRVLSELKSFWVPILSGTRNKKPLNLPAGECLSECSPARLQDMAFHRLRLDANWSRPSPEGSVTSFRTKSSRVVTVVPATDIIILLTNQLSGDTKLYCYDTKTMEKTFKLVLPVTSLTNCTSVPLQAKGEYRIAFQQPPFSLTVVCVHHKEGKATDFRMIFHTELPLMRMHRPFLYGDFVAIISYQVFFPKNVFIMAFNVNTGEKLQILTDLPLLYTNCDYVTSIVYEGKVYVMIVEDLVLRVFECPVSDLPSVPDHQETAMFKDYEIKLLEDPCPHRLSSDFQDERDILTPVGTPAFGVAAFNAFREDNMRRDSPLRIRFWPSSYTSEHDGGSHLVIKDATGHDIRIPGIYGKVRASSNSGTTLLVTSTAPSTHFFREPECLRLVRYVDGTVSVHELKSVGNVDGGAVDDHNGTVYLMSHSVRADSSTLHCISYA